MYHPALKTPLCELLHIEYPIIQAGMGFVARGELTAAVSAAGGMGTIGAGTMPAEELREEIATVHRITDRPFAVDILFSAVGGKNVQLFTDDVQAHIEVIFEERVPVLASGLGEDPYMAGRRDGKTDIGSLAAGQSSALIRDIQPAGEVVRNLMAEASAALGRIGR